MRTKNRFFGITVLIVLVLACFNTRAKAEAEPIEIVFSTFWPVSYKYLWLPVKHFAENVEKQSNGRVKFKLYHSKQRYGGKDELNALKRGDIDMTCPTDIYHTEIIPEIAIIALPFMYNDPESLQKILDAGLWDVGITQKLLEQNVVLLSPGVGDPIQIFSKGFQVISPEDMKGKKWAVSGAAQSKAVEILGGIPISMSSGKLYMAFQKGVINGCTRPFITGVGRKLYEAVDYLTVTDFSYFTSFLCINKKKWESLPEDIREIMKKADKERIREQSRRMKGFMAEAIDVFKEKGVKVRISTPEEREKFKKAMSPVYDWWISEVTEGKKYIEFIKAHQ